MKLEVASWLTWYPRLSLTGVVPTVCDAEAGETGNHSLLQTTADLINRTPSARIQNPLTILEQTGACT